MKLLDRARIIHRDASPLRGLRLEFSDREQALTEAVEERLLRLERRIAALEAKACEDYA